MHQPSAPHGPSKRARSGSRMRLQGVASSCAAVSIAAALAPYAAGQTGFRSISESRFSIAAGAENPATSSRLFNISTALAISTQSRIWPDLPRKEQIVVFASNLIALSSNAKTGRLATPGLAGLPCGGSRIDPRGTLVERYLKSRALELPDEAALEAIRFHPDCSFEYGERFPAMICLVRNIVTNEPQAIHRTALAADGTAIKRDGKTFRKSLGAIAGGAIKIDPDEDVTQGLCIGEGVETCLAGRQMGLRPIWSIVNTGGIGKFPILSSLDGLRILKENDANGASGKAADECARRWYYAGREVIINKPDIGKDLNDELRERVG